MCPNTCSVIRGRLACTHLEVSRLYKWALMYLESTFHHNDTCINAVATGAGAGAVDSAAPRTKDFIHTLDGHDDILHASAQVIQVEHGTTPPLLLSATKVSRRNVLQAASHRKERVFGWEEHARDTEHCAHDKGQYRPH